MSAADWLTPGWPDVGAVMTTRAGGHSAGPWRGLNLGSHVGDDPAHVEANRAHFAAETGATPAFMNQVHGRRIVRLTAADLGASTMHEADAACTTEPGIACTVMVADCLPLLLAAPKGRGVAAAHAGWRGLANGVVDGAVQALCEAAACEPGDLRVWLGACIGPDRFEVGADVLRAFDALPGDPLFKPVMPAGEPPKWLADLPGLARRHLARLGVRRVEGGSWCTVGDSSRFFSFRRDGVTGRMAAAIWLRGRG